jgi:hypothetical protein
MEFFGVLSVALDKKGPPAGGPTVLERGPGLRKKARSPRRSNVAANASLSGNRRCASSRTGTHAWACVWRGPLETGGSSLGLVAQLVRARA